MSVKENRDKEKRIDDYISEHPDCELKDYEPVFVRGKKKILSVYRLPTEFLYYNIHNGRFAAEYREIIRKEGGTLVPEEPEDAKKIQKMLLGLDLEQTKLDKNDFLEVGQRQAGIITVHGYVIDGNRRLSLITSLFEETQEELWKYMNVARLTETLEKEDLWRLEAGIQLGKEQQQRYGPINTMIKIQQGIDSGISAKQISDGLYGVKEKEIVQILDRLKLIENYLRFINSEQRYSLVNGKDNHFINLQSILGNLKQRGYGVGTITNIKHFVFQLIYEGKAHLDIRKINQAVDRELSDVIDQIADAGEDIEPPQDPPEEKPDEEPPDEEPPDEEDGSELTKAETNFRDLEDQLTVDKNKSHISLLLKTAEKNLIGIDPEGKEFSEEIKKSETQSLIQKISSHLQKLQKKLDE